MSGDAAGDARDGPRRRPQDSDGARSGGAGAPTWLLVLGDQLSHDHPALASLGPADRVLMLEAPGEATHVWSHQARIALFLSAMRHHRDALRERGLNVDYVALGDSGEATLAARLAERLAAARPADRPSRLLVMEPGEFRLVDALASVARRADVPLRWLDDPHFLCSRADFARWTRGRRGWRMEDFYREMRLRHQVLIDADGGPEGGQWNYDADNRRAYGRQGPGDVPAPWHVAPDATTRAVITEVRERFGDHPGALDAFCWPVTRRQALAALHDFVTHRLAGFGEHQDAMWTDTPSGWHSLLASAMNLHLLDPREVIAAAEQAWRDGQVPLAGAEGFIRQILGWREYVRGVYWQTMPGLADANHYRHQRPLPRWYWTGETRMACVRDVVSQTLRLGHAHHIQRLMVTGLFALLAGIDPKQVADWYLAVYVDAVEWVELPNVASMALYADGGRATSKPYLASGAYIDRMSNYCGGCTYAPDARRAAAKGRAVCPFTVLFWGFLDRHADELLRNPRTAPMVRNLERFDEDERAGMRRAAAGVLDDLDSL